MGQKKGQKKFFPSLSSYPIQSNGLLALSILQNLGLSLNSIQKFDYHETRDSDCMRMDN